MAADVSSRLVLKLDWKLVVVACVALVVFGGIVLALVLTRQLPREALAYFGAFSGGTVVGGGLPIARIWREKPITVETESDPPKGEP